MSRFDALTELEQNPSAEEPRTTKVSPASDQKTETSLLANQQTSKLANQQTSLPANEHTGKLAYQQTSKSANQQTSSVPLTTKQKKKYGTYLRRDSIVEIQILSAQEGKKIMKCSKT